MSLLITVLWGLVGLLVVLALLMLIFTWLHAWRLTHPLRRPLSARPPIWAWPLRMSPLPPKMALPFRAGLFRRAMDAPSLAATASSITASNCWNPPVTLTRQGYGFLLYDARAHGASGGRHSTYGHDEIKDVFAAVAYLEARPEVDAQHLGIIGNSLGGITAIRAAARLPQLRVIIAESTLADFAS